MRPRSVATNWNVLAERTQRVAPVRAWVESAQDDEESPVFALAAQIEEEYKEQQKEKERVLKRFQAEVKHRVNQHVKLKRKQQLQTSYEAALKESSIVLRFSDSALQLTPKKSTCLYRCNTDSAICSSGSKIISEQNPNYLVDWERKEQDLELSEQAKTVRKTVQQVRKRLASRKAVSEGDALPGGVWVSRLSIQSGSCKTSPGKAQEGDSGEFPLVGYHDLPTEMQEQQGGPDLEDAGEFQTANSEILKGNYPGPSSEINPETRAAHEFWPGTETEESKKQRQSQYLRYRRLFMDIEREQVKEQQRQKEWQRKMDKIKKEKERSRHAEEQRIQEMASRGKAKPKGKACEKLEQLTLEDMQQKELAERQQKKEIMERRQRNKEYSRYVEALRAQMREKIKMYSISLPPLCFCGSDFWDAHPDNCANNCVFYKNHKAYAQALQSVISSCNLLDGGSNSRLAVHSFATVHAHSKHS
ncbi:coiled-coil domain-containing protein 15 isoform X1 [Varanus komodoensis]|uniref:coiled-coil domain-containing protein 15 isoform X1 n=1 Tax=Varanus komodoensis TaxID=61221 RepID=UPI001CF77330|nr:coiled-coil domain-containing protein 15 isoform X1 [Varanus komodoensis]XP_044293616.1 coiled-coil domain-containing protein 15 isoform X1 [Varanus komodoensis]